MTLTAGARVGPYEILSALGAGGMGEVYRARDIRLGREVALKMLPDAFATDSDRLARFQREARTLASLNHPNIAAVHGLEETPGVTALVMELVEGEDLAERITRGAIPLEEALSIARQIADALAAAHEQGIVHRDLKPANVKLRHDGTVKVLDFGLAKVLGPVAAASAGATISPTITSPAMTGTGIILGTAAYMSPEQAKGREADKRSDVWAFGCVLYEMLTARRAFEGEDVSDTLASILKGEPDWTLLPDEVPSAIRTFIQRCVAKDRRQRIGDIAVAQFLLSESSSFVTRSAPVTVAAPAAPRSRWTGALAIGVAVLVTAALVGAAAWGLRPTVAPQTVARFSFTLPEGQQLTNTGNTLVAISPDGTQLVYNANNRLYLRSIANFETRAISGTEVGATDTVSSAAGRGNVTNPVFSPDGRSIAFFSTADSTLKRISVNGGAAVTICRATLPAYGMSWGADGILFGQRRQGILRVSPNGGTPQPVVSIKEDEIAIGPQMLPGGQAVLFTLANDADERFVDDRWDKAQVVVQSLTSGARKTLIDGGSDARYLPTGHLMYAVGGNILLVPFDVDRQEVTGGPVPVVEGIRRSLFSTGAAHLSVSDTGTLLYVPGPAGPQTNARALALVDQHGAITPLSLPAGPYVHPRVSRDGARIAVGADDGKEAFVAIYELAGTSALRRLTFEGHNRFPIWSADGQRVAFQSDREGDLAIFSQRADGTGPVERLTKPEPGASHVPEAWSPDGKALLFTSFKDAAFTLWVLSADDKKVMPFGDVKSPEPIGSVFSPDGRWVAYATNFSTAGGKPSPNGGVYVQPFPATGARYQVPRTARDFHPVWAPDGKTLFYVPSSVQFAAVAVRTQPSVSFAAPTNLQTAFTGDNRRSIDVRSYDIMPDGRFIGLIRADSTGASTTPELRIVVNWFEELKSKVATE